MTPTTAAPGNAAVQTAASPIAAPAMRHASPLQSAATFVQQMATVESAHGQSQSAISPAIAQSPVAMMAPALEDAPDSELQERGEGVEPDTLSEQWLLGMLSQQQAVLEARERKPGGSSLSNDAVDGELPVVVSASPESAFRTISASTDSVAEDNLQALAGAIVSSAQARKMPSAAAQTVAAAGAWTFADVALEVDPATDARLAAADPLNPSAAPDLQSDRSQTLAPLPDRVIRLQTPETKWGEQMLHALREHVDMQLQQRVQNATIRLDPPELGSLEILLTHESGRLNVQVNAAQPEISRLLQQTSDRLRQELVNQNFVQVNVQVSADARHGQSGQGRQKHVPVDGLRVAGNGPTPPEQSATDNPRSDVLVTV
ncbi:flagellar hook-length control protein FliK [Pseudomonas sp. Marseille-QA0892]